jgi:RNA polymerase sigma factor (sigma-70 family)
MNVPMTATRSSLLLRVRDPSDSASWNEFDSIYRPLLTRYALHRGLDVAGAEDVAQQCLSAVSQRIRKFEKKRSFRAWLRGMVDHKVSDFIAKSGKPAGQLNESMVEASSESEALAGLWEQTWNERLLEVLRDHLRGHFAEHTLRAFEMYVLRDTPVEQIVSLLGMTPNQVYVAKSRVLRYLRESCDEVLDNLYGVDR